MNDEIRESLDSVLAEFILDESARRTAVEMTARLVGPYVDENLQLRNSIARATGRDGVDGMSDVEQTAMLDTFVPWVREQVADAVSCQNRNHESSIEQLHGMLTALRPPETGEPTHTTDVLNQERNQAHRIGASQTISEILHQRAQTEDRAQRIVLENTFRQLAAWFYQRFGVDYDPSIWGSGGAERWEVIAGHVRVKGELCGHYRPEVGPCEREPVVRYVKPDPHAYEDHYRCTLHRDDEQYTDEDLFDIVSPVTGPADDDPDEWLARHAVPLDAE